MQEFNRKRERKSKINSNREQKIGKHFKEGMEGEGGVGNGK